MSRFASSPTRRNGFFAPPPEPMLEEPAFWGLPERDSMEEGEVDELVRAAGDPMPLVIVMVHSTPRQLQSIEWLLPSSTVPARSRSMARTASGSPSSPLSVQPPTSSRSATACRSRRSSSRASTKVRARMRDDTPPSLFDLTGSGQRYGRFEPARLTQARVRRSMTKTELAAEVGVSAAAIGQYEANINSPRPMSSNAWRRHSTSVRISSASVDRWLASRR